MMRAQETGLGILVYSLVSILIWPISSRADFEAAACELCSTQKQLYRSYLDLMRGDGSAGEAQALRAREVQHRPGLANSWIRRRRTPTKSGIAAAVEVLPEPDGGTDRNHGTLA